MSKYRGIILILFGMLMVFTGMGLYVRYDYQDEMAGRNSEALLAELAQGSAKEGEAIDEGTDETQEMPIKRCLGYEVFGIIRIPDLAIELPVLDSWDYELLNIAPCRYKGSLQEENLILMGHNYKSHFSPIKKIEIGEAVELVSVTGTVYRFKVAELEQLHKNEVDNLLSDYPLTLFTCTAGGEHRFVVRCKADEGL